MKNDDDDSDYHHDRARDARLDDADTIARLRSELDQAEVMERLELRDGDRQSATYWAKVAAARREALESYGVPVYVQDEG